MGLIFWSDVSQKIPTQFSMCCGMLWYAAACFKTPTVRPQKQALRHAAACFNCWCLSACHIDHFEACNHRAPLVLEACLSSAVHIPLLFPCCLPVFPLCCCPVASLMLPLLLP